MSYSVSNESIETLKNQINIVDVIGAAVPLKKAGNNYKGVCPFHNEKTPSFVVSEEKQIFTCFGCGAHGDVIGFVEKYYNLEFVEALEKLSREYNIPLEKSGNTGPDLSRYYEANRLAALYWHNCLKKGNNTGLSYMTRRGITPATMVRFGIGYADGSWDSLYRYLKSRGVRDSIMLELGLVSKSKNGKIFDRFRDRVMFPIINTSNKVIGFGGRALAADAQAKYLNSPESKVFKKKYNLYGLNLSRKDVMDNDAIILVEGYMDVISLYQSGIRNVGASLGTALTENQARLINRYTRNVVLSYDSDSAGVNAALRGMEILKDENCKVRVLHVADGKDPDEFVKKNGKDAFLSLVDRAMPYEDYKIAHIRSKFNLDNDQGRIEFVKAVAPVLKSFSPVERDIYLKKVAADAGISPTVLNLEIEGAKTEQAVRMPEKDDTGNIPHISRLEKDLIGIIIRDENYVRRLKEHEEMLESSSARRIFSVIEKDYKENGTTDLKRIYLSLEGPDRMLLKDIVDNVPVSGNYEQIFDDCLIRHQLMVLSRREKEIITLLELADSEEEQKNRDQLNNLTAELMEIQEKIHKLK